MSGPERDWEAIAVGDGIGPVVDEIDYRRVIMSPATTLDYFPGHFDPEYARSLGHPTIFVNTMHLMGFVDRVALEPFGPTAFLRRRTIKLRHPVYAGDTITATGQVVQKGLSEPKPGSPLVGLVEIDIAVANQHDALCCEARVMLELALPGPNPPDS